MMMAGSERDSTPIAQSLLAKVQLGLPGTVVKISSKMRFIDSIAPLLRKGGVVKPVQLLRPLTIKAAGIATAYRTVTAFGGVLYCAGAVRQDIYVNEGSVYQTFQDSVVDVDEVDELDILRKMKFIQIMQTYRLLDELMQEQDRPKLVMADVPLVLEHTDQPAEGYEELQTYYKECLNIIEAFWDKHAKRIYPFSNDGIYLVSLNSKKFGAVFYGLTDEKQRFILDEISEETIKTVEQSFDKVKRVGLQKLLNGALPRNYRTAAYDYRMLTDQNRLHPVSIRKLGLAAYHFRAGMQTKPCQVEFLGARDDWEINRLNDLASSIVSLYTIDQPKARPLPLWYAAHALKPVSSGALLQYFKTQTREMIKNEEVESVWKEELDLFGGEHNG